MTYRYDNEQAEFCECGEILDDDGQCVECDYGDEYDEYDECYYDECYDEYDDDDGLSDAEADAMTLRDAGMGIDEDYGYYGSEYDEY